MMRLSGLIRPLRWPVLWPAVWFGLYFAVIPLTAQTPGEKKGASERLGISACATCHDDVAKTFRQTAHARSPLACEGCHGSGKAHAAEGDKSKIRSMGSMTPSESSALCLSCHEKGTKAHWKGSAHDSNDVACVACHDPHPKGEVHAHLLAKPQEELCTSCHLQKKGSLMRSGHMPMREGKMQCSTCHNPHGTPNEKMLLQASVNQNCYSCHADKRGPFLWEHPPVREDCLNCHDAHGSIQDHLLKTKMPMLCQQCHIGTRHPGQIHVSRDRYAFNQGCMNCHPKIHGSTHPSGNAFWR